MAIIGSIIGDIVGSQFEMNLLKEKDWKTCSLFTDDCFFTDDTVMTLAVKYAIDNNISYELAMKGIGQNYPFCGYGPKFFDWIFDPYSKPYNSFGNGSAMRVSYIPDYYDNIDEIMDQAKESAMVSHNHPEGIKGAIVIVTCIWMAKHFKSKEEIYNYVLTMYPSSDYKYSGKTIDELEKSYIEDITCMTSIPAAARCFYESDSYISFLRNTFRFKNDTDTFGAMFGGVAEEYYKTTGLDNETILKKYLNSELYNIYKGGVSYNGK